MRARRKWLFPTLLFASGLAALGAATDFRPESFRLSAPQRSTEVYLAKPFHLVSQHGKSFTDQDFRTKPTAWFFGFTHCPDICPTTLADLTAVLKRLGSDGDRLNVVFVTVDPERDTPEALTDYLSSFDPRIVGLTGERGEIEAMAKGYFVHQAKVRLPNGDYTMEHTSKVLLTGRDGKFEGTIDAQDPIEEQSEKLRRLVRQR
jgi:protein SCO1